jgi:hypothetical protein
MSLKRVLENFPFGIKSCDWPMFVNEGAYYMYKCGEWSEVKNEWSGYFDIITDEPVMKLNYIKIEDEDDLSFLNWMMSKLLAKETRMLTKKMMIYNVSNEIYLPELSLMIAGVFFKLGVM